MEATASGRSHGLVMVKKVFDLVTLVAKDYKGQVVQVQEK